MPERITLKEFLLTKEFMMAVEIALILVGVLMILYSHQRPLIHPEFASVVAASCVTFSGILSAFSGFWLSHIYTHSTDATKKWLSKRIAVLVIVIGSSMFFVLRGLTELVYNTPESAVSSSIFGVGIIVLVDLYIIFLTFYKWIGDGKEELK